MASLSMNYSLILITMVTAIIHNAYSLHCFSCLNILDGQDCTAEIQCASNQKCFSRRTGQGNTSLFTHGCIDNQHCPEHHPFEIMGRSTQDSCLDCCIGDGCNIDLCHLPYVAVAGGWAQWSSWSTCSTSCGVGTYSRTRSCTASGVQHCQGNATQRHACFLRECPVHGEWSTWAPWEECSVSCYEGVKKRHRTCTNPAPSLYGHNCIGDPVEFNICNEQPCPVNSTQTQSGVCMDILSDCHIANSTTSNWCSQVYARKICAKFCGFCSIVPDSWNKWSSWGACSTSCDKGTWTRSRSCPVLNACAGNSNETAVCDLRACPVHGGWSSWLEWTQCSTSCGPGLAHRRRTCTNPTPSLQGNICFGDPLEYTMCLKKQCPVSGGWTSWSVWSGCSVSCGQGQITRLRSCTNPSPVHGGQNCIGDASQQSNCRLVDCPVHGGWTAWGTWSRCDVNDDVGQSHRRRRCANPTPSSSGMFCHGDPVEYKTCYGCSQDGAVQLVSNKVKSTGANGTVQLCVGGSWGTVCDDGWDRGLEAAKVVCKGIDPQYDCGHPFSNARFGSGHGDILLDDVSCSGNESSLLRCSHSGIRTHNCAHSEDAGVECGHLSTGYYFTGVCII